MPRHSRPSRSDLGRRGRDSGRAAEALAALWLVLKGYRVIGFRVRTPMGEIDLVAVRRGRLVAVEVKKRPTLAEAREALSHAQRERLLRAAAWLASRRRGVSDPSPRLDLIAFAPGRAPRHLRDLAAFSDNGSG